MKIKKRNVFKFYTYHRPIFGDIQDKRDSFPDGLMGIFTVHLVGYNRRLYEGYVRNPRTDILLSPKVDPLCGQYILYNFHLSKIFRDYTLPCTSQGL